MVGSMCGSKNERNDDFELLRLRMVHEQIAARDIRDPGVLDAMRKVPRHEFVPKNIQAQAYGDFPLSIGHEQTISQPYIVAYMTEALRIKKGDKVLEIGTGSGYQAAVLAEMGARVYSIEIIEPLAILAKKTLSKLGYKVHVKVGDGYDGWPEEAPFDGIIVTAAPPEIPRPLIRQLKEGARLVVPVGQYIQNLKVLKKSKGKLIKEATLPVRFVPMTGKVGG
jgi:protein-L-isoaspartate(D-aspartate) O-methyltransferase